jgi:hypothetical protein
VYVAYIINTYSLYSIYISTQKIDKSQINATGNEGQILTINQGNLIYANVASILRPGKNIEINSNGTITANVTDIVFNTQSVANVLAGGNVPGNINIIGSITANSFSSSGTGISSLVSETNINLTSNGSIGSAVVITNSPLRLRGYTTAQINNIIAVEGDLVFNSNTKLVMCYNGSTWSSL